MHESWWPCCRLYICHRLSPANQSILPTMANVSATSLGRPFWDGSGPGKITNENDCLVSMSWKSWKLQVHICIAWMYNTCTNIHMFLYTCLWAGAQLNAIRNNYMLCHSFEHNVVGSANAVAKMVPNLLPISMCILSHTVSVNVSDPILCWCDVLH